MKLPKVVIKRYEERPLYRETSTELYQDYVVELRFENLTHDSSTRLAEFMFNLIMKIDIESVIRGVTTND